MEPANAHHHHLHHHLQDELVGSSSTSCFHGVGTTTSTHANCIPNPILSTNGLSSRQLQENTTPLVSNSPYMNFNMAPDLGLISFINQYSEINNEQANDIPTKMLHKNFSSGNQLMNASRIFPSINVPNSYRSELRDIPTAGGSFDMNLQAMDLLSSSGFSGSLTNLGASQNQIGVFRDGLSYGFGDHMRQIDHIPLFMTSNKISATSSNGNAAAKRPSSKMALLSNAPKKSCSETRASCPPFKVRKEKLGDRIAALQQLVAPFGKTDTASVLMEAIGYIKFLQDQVQTLSVPYMKTSRNKTSRVIKRVAAGTENTEETKQDLRSRGLCLVPLSCLSYLGDGGGAAVWPPCT